MTDIEVGSLWVADFSGDLAEVLFCTEKSVVYKLEKLNNEYLTRIFEFIHNYKPYTPPKEYKVWVYEDSQGVEHVCLKEPVMFKKIKSILTGKEGDGL